MDDLQTRIERELVAAAGRSRRLRYARSRLPQPAALAVVATSVALCLAGGFGVSLAYRAPSGADEERSADRPATDSRLAQRLIAQSKAREELPDMPLGGERLSPGATAAAIKALSARVPLPPGGNFDGIQWPTVMTRGDVAFTLEYNAACQWARAHAEGRLRNATRPILVAIPHWPALRTTNSGPVWQLRAEAMLNGADAPQECHASLSGEDTSEAELRRASQTPAPAPAALAASYSALADGEVHSGPHVGGAKVTVHGNSVGGCIRVLPDGAQGPGGTCFTEADVKTTSLWNTLGDIMVVLVPDAATDISIQTVNGIRRPVTATNNLVAAHRSEIIRYSVSGKQTTVAPDGSEP